MDNYRDVVSQLTGAGLLLDGELRVGTAKPVRCRVDGDREKRGWYWLSETPAKDGRRLLVGSYGIWHGADNGVRRVELRRTDELTAESRDALRKALAEQRRRADAMRKAEAERAAARAAKTWRACAPTGESGYLSRKGVGAHGVRFTPSGSIAVPMCDPQGRIHGLQFILPTGHPHAKKIGRDKTYWPQGLAVAGHYHQIGGSPDAVGLIAEGYATAATLHEATGLPVAVAFSANNLQPVAEVLHKANPRARLLICADDDYLTDGNPGVAFAEAAALAVSGAVAVPQFADDRAGVKITDYNDLAALEGLNVVRSQIEARLGELGWHRSGPSRAKPSLGGTGDGGDAPPVRGILTADDACERYSLIYGGKATLFDHQERLLVPKSDVLDCLQDHAWRDWKLIPDRKVVRLDEVGFDPAGQDPRIKCNLWGGWPTKPKAGSCELILELLEYLCANEQDGSGQSRAAVYDWVLKWLAYPIQHPGAKMRTALVFHGPQGAGKNLFFETILAIYGDYGRIVDQNAVEDKFNDWASRKLFIIADEVVARAELFHTKNKLKALITSDTIRINPKNVAAHEERNHLNVVFLSNERQPLVLEEGDRRYVVIWVPDSLPANYYREVGAEVANGGVAALHHHLLNLDLGDFSPYTPPPMTRSKRDLIDVSLGSEERFINDWISGFTPYPVIPCASMDLYTAYLRWCRTNGVARPRESNQFLALVGKLKGWTNQPRHVYDTTHCIDKTRPKRIVLPAQAVLDAAGTAQPTGKTQSVYLTHSYFEFSNALTAEKALS